MWKRRDEEYMPRPSVPATSATDTTREGMPMSTMSSRSPEPSYEPTRSTGVAVLGKSVMLKGQIYSREDLTIDGEVEGTVELQEHRLTIGPNGRVQASIKAREIVILGTVHGNVEAADKIDIRKDARLVGDIKTARIVIEDGAYFKGSIDITKADVPKAEKKPQPAPPPPPAPAAVPAAAASNDAKR